MSSRHYKSFGLILTIFFIDQVTKYLVLKYLSPDKTIKLLPFFNLVYVENTGTAFGMFKFLGSEFFIVLALVVTGFVIYIYLKDTKNWVTYSLILGGAFGNITDRLIYGYVIDFIDLHIKNLHWPAFNVADSAISVGIILFLYHSLKR